MESSQTLHDFVLTLLSDPDARTAFEVDPEGTLHDAGLTDITAGDVQDVIPLVIDYAPIQGVPDLDGLGAVDAGPAGAIQQLQLVTQQLPSLGTPTSAEVNAAVAGTLTTGVGGLTTWAGAGVEDGEVTVTTGGELSSADPFAASHDVTATLDAPVLDTVPAEVTDIPHTAGGLLDSTAPVTDGLTGTVSGLTDDVHGLTGGLTGDLTDDHPGTAPVESTLSHVTDTVGSSGLGDLTGVDHGTVGDKVTDTTQHLPAGDIIDGLL
jgi:hypothetical protein